MHDLTQIVMPQVGEGISEATIIAWHKKVGDLIGEGETLLDITTAKIDIEIPAPADGVVSEIRYPDNTTVPVDTVIAVIAPRGTPVAPSAVESVASEANAEASVGELAREKEPAGRTTHAHPSGSGRSLSLEEDTESQRRAVLRKRSTPLVRRMAGEMGLDLSSVVGTGIHGRVTRRDLEAYLERKRAAVHTKAEKKTPNSVHAPEEKEKESLFDSATPMVAERRSEPMSAMRKMIAEHMERSYRRSPHAFTVFEFDFTRVEKLRIRYRETFHRTVGAKLTPLGFLLKAIADVLPRFPVITAFVREDQIIYPSEINLGVAVAIPNGLLVPVLHNVEGKPIEELVRELQDVAARARQGKLVLSDVEGGTFTVTSPGQLGCLMGIPIINQPQSAILHIGAITKVPAVVTSPDGEDTIAVRHKAILTLGFDHRLIDGWEADSFMSALRERIESGDFSLDQYV